MGITSPEKISPVTISIAIIPLSSIINIVIMCISRAIAVTNKLDIIIDIMNNIRDNKLIGEYSL